MKIQKLLQEFPKTYSQELGINLDEGWDEIFKWFLASILFGKRISEEIAKKTYKEFERENLLTPEKISKAGWNKLVEVLDAGNYVRYDFSTATKLLEIMKELKEKSLEKLYEESKNSEDFEKKLKEFKGVGNVTINIFLRELRFLPKVSPSVSKFVKLAAKNLNVSIEKFNRKSKEFIHVESSLLRLGKNFCNKGKCAVCMLKKYCITFNKIL